MITFSEAKQIALEKIGSDFILNENEIIEKPYGWYFSCRSKSNDEIVFGSNGFIVDREDGHVFQFGSAYSLERDIAAYEAGFRFDLYDLIILSVSNTQKTVQLLLDLDMHYVLDEEENGTVWKIPKKYEREQIQSALQSLPCTFPNQKFYFMFEKFLEIDKENCCTYQLDGHRQNKS